MGDLGNGTPTGRIATLNAMNENERLIITINQLASLVNDKVVEVPKIVVVGDQSSGKSSLVERIT